MKVLNQLTDQDIFSQIGLCIVSIDESAEMDGKMLSISDIFKNTVKHFDAPIALAHMNGKFIDANIIFSDLAGCAMEDLQDMSLMDFTTNSEDGHLLTIIGGLSRSRTCSVRYFWFNFNFRAYIQNCFVSIHVIRNDIHVPQYLIVMLMQQTGDEISIISANSLMDAQQSVQSEYSVAVRSMKLFRQFQDCIERQKREHQEHQHKHKQHENIRIQSTSTPTSLQQLTSAPSFTSITQESVGHNADLALQSTEISSSSNHNLSIFSNISGKRSREAMEDTSLQSNSHQQLPTTAQQTLFVINHSGDSLPESSLPNDNDVLEQSSSPTAHKYPKSNNEPHM